MVSYTAYQERPIATPRIPPTAVGGCFIPNLLTDTNRNLENPTDRSRWMVHTQPTNRDQSQPRESHRPQSVDASYPTYLQTPVATPRIPPTAVGGWFIPNLLTETKFRLENPTDRSRWIVHT
jgi:hypothetical protein